jgi:hypothetical protein
MEINSNNRALCRKIIIPNARKKKTFDNARGAPALAEKSEEIAASFETDHDLSGSHG